MKHKAISIIILMSFGVFSVSCYSIKPIDPHLLSSRNADDLEIRKVEKMCLADLAISKYQQATLITVLQRKQCYTVVWQIVSVVFNPDVLQTHKLQLKRS